MSVIAVIVGMLVFICGEVVPLARSTSVTPLYDTTRGRKAPAALAVDEYLGFAALLDAGAGLRVVRLADGHVESETPVDRAIVETLADPGLEERPVGGLSGLRSLDGQDVLTAQTGDGRVVAARVLWDVEFDAHGQRVVTGSFPEVLALELDPDRRPLGAWDAHGSRSDDGSSLRVVAQLADGSLSIASQRTEINEIFGTAERTVERETAGVVERLERIVIAPDARDVYGFPGGRSVLWWTRRAGAYGEPRVIAAPGAAVTAATLLAGGSSLAVGRSDGVVEIWFQVREDDDSIDLRHVRSFPGPASPVRHIAPSPRDRSFFVAHENGALRLLHSTSERVLWEGETPLSDATAYCFAPKGDGLAIASAEKVVTLLVDNPHPEVSWSSLFAGVWYEDNPTPELVWQSDGGSDHFEPKTSLSLLFIGTLKGTFYSLVVAIPLGVLGALYTSQFLANGLQRFIKPAVEVMAALPTVILGFIAGLWLAPRLQNHFPALILGVLALPVTLAVSGALWDRLPRRWRGRLPDGIEVLVFTVALGLVFGACVAANDPFESLAFSGDFSAWLQTNLELGYDQRNAIVVGLAMGFAVIPIVFSISEEAFSSVPRALVSASLALGATRWQTVRRIVLPTASPGVFAAVMVGFGRAVGETMVVLMATGNTPILDWSPFNGFRTLSANIAVEIPEAPHGGSLYRILFLSAVMLFAITFLVNTLAEVVRSRLRKRFGQL